MDEEFAVASAPASSAAVAHVLLKPLRGELPLAFDMETSSDIRLRRGQRGAGLLVTALLALAPWASALAQDPASETDPLRWADVPQLARQGRSEVVAARERAVAAGERPAIVSALEDPMISPSVDHWPFGMPVADVSLAIEQRFPLSGIRGHRGRAAEAEATRLRSDEARVALDVELNAVSAFLMLYERRGVLRILEEQRGLAKMLVDATNARYRSATGAQADVIRAEIEVARIAASLKSAAAEIKASEAMLNANLGRPWDLPVPELLYSAPSVDPPDAAVVVKAALDHRPELRGGEAEIGRAEAEVAVMGSMYAPMALVRAGPSFTMIDGPGAMLMVGLSIPIWRGRLSAGVSEAEAMSRMARADLQAMRRMTEGQAATARAEVVAARAQFLSLRDDVLPRAKQAIEPSVSGYAAGQLPLVSVVEAARTLWAVQVEVLAAEVSLGAAWARLGRATGDVEGVLDGTP